MTSAEMLRIANRAWSILWRRLRRRFGSRAVGYAKIVELTKAGTPHLHIIATVPFIAQRELSVSWAQLTGSYIVDIRKVSQKRGVAGYLTSYLTKALDVPPGMRKWSAARAYVPPEPPSPREHDEIPPTASFRTAEVDNIVAAYLAAGYTYIGAWLVAPPAVRPLEWSVHIGASRPPPG